MRTVVVVVVMSVVESCESACESCDSCESSESCNGAGELYSSIVPGAWVVVFGVCGVMCGRRVVGVRGVVALCV